MYENNDFVGSGFQSEPELKLFEELSSGRIVLYHGTSSVFQSDIEGNGLRPNDRTGNRNFKKGGRHGLVYLGIPEVAFQYAGHSVDVQGGTPILLEVVVSRSDLVPDEDSGLDPDEELQEYLTSYISSQQLNNPQQAVARWLQSMFRIGTCAHDGTVDKDNIEVYATQSDFGRLARKIEKFRAALRNPPQDYRIDNPIGF